MMDCTTQKKRAHFTVFRSALEEAELKAEKDRWGNEGGHDRAAGPELKTT